VPRWALILITVAGFVLILVGSVAALLLVDHGTCSGDGGSPFSADDSLAGRFCHGPLRGLWATALLVVPVAALLVLAILGIVRARALLVGIGVAAGYAAVVGLSAAVIALPSHCSGSDQRAYDRWVDGGRSGPRPADCERY